MAAWRFRAHRRDEKIRNPIQGEFFSEEAVEKPAQALVREVVQNSLDARAGAQPVHVRFAISGPEEMTEVAARFWLQGAWAHLRAPENGLRSVPDSPRAGRFLAIEDFGTSGLEGDPDALRPEGVPSRLFAFFRAEGISQKGGKDGGRWGVGKTVFLRASDLNTMLCLTVRKDDGKRLVFGQSVLRHHWLDGTYFTPDGAFGEVDDAFGEDDGKSAPATVPSGDPKLAERMRRDFALTRDAEPGLSVIVPFASEDLSGSAVVEAVMREYFYPILSGQLVLTVDDPAFPDGPVTLTADGLLDQLLASKSLSGSIGPLAALTIWLGRVGFDTAVSLAAPKPGTPAWSADMIPPAVRDDLAARYRKGDTLLVRVPLTVHPLGEQPRESHFFMVLRRDLSDRGAAPAFVRNGIQIPKALERRVRGQNLWALVVIEDQPIATLLGDAETPAHTHWSKDTQNFRNKYRYGAATIDFVRTAPRFVAEALTEAVRERDFLALVDFFPLQESGEARTAPTSRPSRHPEPPESSLEDLGLRGGSSGLYRVERLDGGFRVSTARAASGEKEPFTVAVAYDCTRGDPLRRWSPRDFDLSALPRRLEGASLLNGTANQLTLAPEGFVRLEITGFDPNRDLFVKLSSHHGAGDDDPQA